MVQFNRACLISALILLISIVTLGEDFADARTARMSINSAGMQGDASSQDPIISSDGRYVTFASYASNLVIGDVNGRSDIFIHDRQTGQTEIVSVNSAGEQGNLSSFNSSISADGRYVAFASFATNLVAGDTNNRTDTFVHDRQTGDTIMVSVATDGDQGNDDSEWASISSNGRYVVFRSSATNLVTGDTNAVLDIFVHDRDADENGIFDENAPGSISTNRVSIDSTGGQSNGDSNYPAISETGLYVTFLSAASNLVTGDLNSFADIFVHDRQTGQTSRVSIDSAGNEANHSSQVSSISSNGRYVAFSSFASNLVPGDTNGRIDVFVHDRITGVTAQVSVSSAGEQGNDVSMDPYISSDGMHVVFESIASNLVVGDTRGKYDIFVHNRQTGQTKRVSVSSAGSAGNLHSYDASISANGRYVAFDSEATNLVVNDTNSTFDVFVYAPTESAPLPIAAIQLLLFQ